MPDWSRQLFLLLNAPAQPPNALVEAVALLAGSPVLLMPGILVALWIRGDPARRGGLLAVAAATVVGQGMNMFLGLFVFDPRPFTLPIGHTLVAHVADNGFPSDHATLVWTLGTGLLLTHAAPRWGLAVLLYGLAVAWSRIWLGVHFPADMAGSAGVGLLCGILARAATPAVAILVIPYADRAYGTALRILRLPPALFPRGP